MSDEIKPEVIKKTQTSLGKYIKKPPLTEKLLRKPPFRFLHDIISAVIKETGFLEGLFSENESHSDFKDKEAKIAYLTKLIDVVKLITGVELTVRPAKIVCGQEPAKTNQLLQAIATALDKNIKSTEAIKHYKAISEKNPETSPRSNTPKRAPLEAADASNSVHGKKTKEQHETDRKPTRGAHVANRKSERREKVVRNRDGLPTSKSQSTRKVKIVDENSAPTKISSNSSAIDKTESPIDSQLETKELPKTDNERIQAEVPDKSEPTLPPEADSNGTINRKQGEDHPQVSQSTPSQEKDNKKESELIDKNSGAEKSIQSLQEDDDLLLNAGETTASSVSERPVSKFKHSFRPPSGRPPSARPAAPKLRWKSEFSIKTNELEPMENESVILHNFDAQDDDKDSMVVVETDAHERSAIDNVNENAKGDITQEHGYLVAQIIDTQRELAKTTANSHVPIKIDQDLDEGSIKAKESTVQEVNKLCSEIQTLTRATNPMGNLLDFWQEDVDIMQKELFEWRNQFKQLYDQLKIEQTSSHTWAKQKEESLAEIKAAINDQHDKIHHIKQNIIKNNSKVQHLLDGHA